VDGTATSWRSPPGDRQRNDRPTVTSVRGVPRPKYLARRPARTSHEEHPSPISKRPAGQPGISTWRGLHHRQHPKRDRAASPTSETTLCSAGPGTWRSSQGHHHTGSKSPPSPSKRSPTTANAQNPTSLAHQPDLHRTLLHHATCSPPVKCGALTGPTPLGVVFDYCPSPASSPSIPPTPTPFQPGAGARLPGKLQSATSQDGVRDHQQLRPVEYGHGLFGSATEVNANRNSKWREVRE